MYFKSYYIRLQKKTLMTVTKILAELKTYSCESVKKIFLKHGAKEPFYGVKVEDLKKIVKKVKKDYTLSLELYNTGNSDAMYLAGLIADEQQMTKKDLQHWAKNGYWYMISEFTVAWVAAESKYGHELALEWIEAKEENIACSGWSTYSNLLALTPDDQLDKAELKKLLERIEKEIPAERNRVKHTMNMFVIAVGGYVPDLTNIAIETGKKIGKVTINMGDTACKTPYIPEYIDKMILRGSAGKKKKTVRC